MINDEQDSLNQPLSQGSKLNQASIDKLNGVNGKPIPNGEQYSFNLLQSEVSISHSQTYPSLKHSSVADTRSDLHLKYSSIYQQLKGVEPVQIIQLFLQELEEHQKTRAKQSSTERLVGSMREELNELKNLLVKKRQAIAQLCMAQSDHLNLIEVLQGQVNSKLFSSEGHFQKKYRQLESYMNEYIASTKQVQEQLLKNLKIAKYQNNQLLVANEQLQQLSYGQSKQIQVLGIRVERLKKSCGFAKEKQSNMAITLQNLEQQCIVLRKQNDQLKEDLKATQQFKIELRQENRELSSELDFIREKINENNSIRKDIVERIEEHSQNSIKLTKEIEKVVAEKEELERQCQHLTYLLEQNTQDKQKNNKEKAVLSENYEEMIVLLEQARAQLVQNNEASQILREEVGKLKQELAGLIEQHEELQQLYEQERESKQGIKEQLLQLADQVRFMEQTYKKELTQNQRIKFQLQKYWQKRQNPLIEINSNVSVEHSPTFQPDSARQKTTQRSNHQEGNGKENILRVVN